jgi:hypothetical protein
VIKYGTKLRISGLYLDQATVNEVERERRKMTPVPSFNKQLLELIHEALRSRRCQKQTVPRKWQT